MNMNMMQQTFINVLLTLIFIYAIKKISLTYNVPFMKDVVKDI